MNENKYHGMIAEFASPAALVAAAAKLREAGYVHYDAHSPFPIHGMDRAMALKPTKLGTIAFCVAATGLLCGASLEVWASTLGYAIRVGGKPLLSWPAFVPVAYEVTILSAAFATVLGMFYLNGLPKLFNPLFRSARFPKFSNDGFFLSVEARDLKFNPQTTKTDLENLGGKNLELVEA